MVISSKINLLELIKARRSTRRFKEDPVPDSDLTAVLEAAQWSPSGENHQPWKIIVIKKKETMEKIVELIPYKVMQMFIKRAPVLIGILVNEQKSPWAVLDGAICVQNMMLEAWSLGLGMCFSAWWPTAPKTLTDSVKELLNIPEKWTILTFTPLGYPDPDPKRAFIFTKRKPIEKIVAYEQFPAESTPNTEQK